MEANNWDAIDGGSKIIGDIVIFWLSTMQNGYLRTYEYFI